jgi:aldose 1-epimerase
MPDILHQELVELQSGALRLLLSPSFGGSILRFDWAAGGKCASILRPWKAPSANILEVGSFPLVPFVNRIRAGSFRFRDRLIKIAPNLAREQCPLHGHGWLGAWTVDGAADSSAALSFRHQPDEWPWAYTARQLIVLKDDELSIVLSCLNTSKEPMPCGLGQHPYFECGPNTRIQAQVENVWTIDDNVLPVQRIAASGRFDLRDRMVCNQGLDHGFDGWSGKARLTDAAWPFEITVSSPTARFLHLYSPKGGGICAVEPVTHANTAFNEPESTWSDLGPVVLEDGDQMTLEMRIKVSTPQNPRYRSNAAHG